MMEPAFVDGGATKMEQGRDGGDPPSVNEFSRMTAPALVDGMTSPSSRSPVAQRSRNEGEMKAMPLSVNETAEMSVPALVGGTTKPERGRDDGDAPVGVDGGATRVQ
jgi:hypothetical protein